MEAEISNKTRQLLSKMTLEEKARLCCGGSFFETSAIDRLGIPSINIADGPNGLRKQKTDALNPFDGIPATSFPSAANMASSWDRDAIRKMAHTLARECISENVAILLAPGMNIKRSPLCGRNFEYYSEDPCLTGELATTFISEVERCGVGTCPKHFALNNQETDRMRISAEIDEASLREVYLAGFEKAVTTGKPTSILCSYNKINGVRSSENRWLLSDVLREEWGFDGLVISDWGAVTEHDVSIVAGVDLAMPYSGDHGPNALLDAVKSGELSMDRLDQAASRVIAAVVKYSERKQRQEKCNLEEHHHIAQDLAADSMVLLKNEDSFFPLRGGRIAVIGRYAQNPPIQGWGSAQVTPFLVDNPNEELANAMRQARIAYADGYGSDHEVSDDSIQAACALAESADVALLFIGLPSHSSTEGRDRSSLALPQGHIELLRAVSKVQKNIGVVLFGGSAVEMPWIDLVKGLLFAGLAGQGTGHAIAKLLSGAQNPSGKLAETFPMRIEQSPAFSSFPGCDSLSEYTERNFVGYRWFDLHHIEPLFAFGFGLSYTRFEYSDLALDSDWASIDGRFEISFSIRNIGAVRGAEISQVYVRLPHRCPPRPLKVLTGFAKTVLEPGETRVVTIELKVNALSQWDSRRMEWKIEPGEYMLLIGSSSRDIHLEKRIRIRGTPKRPLRFERQSTVSEWLADPIGKAILEPVLKRLIAGFVAGSIHTKVDDVDPGELGTMLKEMYMHCPLINLCSLTGGALRLEDVDALVEQANALNTSRN